MFAQKFAFVKIIMCEWEKERKKFEHLRCFEDVIDKMWS